MSLPLRIVWISTLFIIDDSPGSSTLGLDNDLSGRSGLMCPNHCVGAAEPRLLMNSKGLDKQQ